MPQNMPKKSLANGSSDLYSSHQPREATQGTTAPLATCLTLATRLTWRTTLKKTGTSVTLTWIRTHDWDAADWRTEAICRNSNPELFFPIGATGSAADQIEAAKEICGICPAATPCLEFAMATNQENGVWGGRTEEERRMLRRDSAVSIAFA